MNDTGTDSPTHTLETAQPTPTLRLTVRVGHSIYIPLPRGWAARWLRAPKALVTITDHRNGTITIRPADLAPSIPTRFPGPNRHDRRY